MPATSKKQYRFFQWLAHNPKAAKAHHMSTETAKEYVSHNEGHMSYHSLPLVKHIMKKFKGGCVK